jgi:DNA-3-methyladenine glycosylase
MTYLTKEFFARDTVTVARELIGAVLIVGGCEGRIVETEAYTTDDASHSVIRKNQAAAMTNTYGHVYVYFTYGMYYCLNFTTEREGVGAVLIRAVEPLSGIEEMSCRRRTTDPKKLASGPGRLCQAFGIDLSFDGWPIAEGARAGLERAFTERSRAGSALRQAQHEIRLLAGPGDLEICSSPRIGISRATDLEWRFFEPNNSYVSGTKKRRS